MFYLQTLLILLLSLLKYSFAISPNQFEAFITLLAFNSGLKLHKLHLGKTVNQNSLIAYGLTSYQSKTHLLINQQSAELQNIPGTLLTSLFHPRQINTVILLKKLLENVVELRQSDNKIKFMLENTVLWIMPYVNIDGYYAVSKLNQSQQKRKIRKNLNRGSINCQNQFQYGVDVNRNFDSNYGMLLTSSNPCGIQYRGQASFSQKQSQAVRKIFDRFPIKLAIDIHSYGNEWIYPYAFDQKANRVKQHFLYPQYQYIENILRKKGQKVVTCFESLQYTADGVYIDWALDQGALTFAYQFGTSFLDDKNVTLQITKVVPAFIDVLKMNSFEYQVKRKEGKLLIQSNSLIDFSIQLIIGNQQQIIVLSARELTEVVTQLKDQRISIKIVGGNQSDAKQYLVSEIEQQPRLFHVKNRGL